MYIVLTLSLNKYEMKHFNWSDMLLGVQFVKKYAHIYGGLIILIFTITVL